MQFFKEELKNFIFHSMPPHLSLSDVRKTPNTKRSTVRVRGGAWERYVLVDHQVWGEAQHVAVTLLVRSPAQTKRHEEEPGGLEQSHLIVQVKVPETYRQKRRRHSFMSLRDERALIGHQSDNKDEDQYTEVTVFNPMSCHFSC